jgi:hypothetical protein
MSSGPRPPDEGDSHEQGGLPSYESSFPSYPEDSAGGGQVAAQPAQPPSMRTAVRLMWAGAGLSALSLVVTLITLSSLRSHLRTQLAKSNPTFSNSDFNTTYHAVVGGAVIGAVIAIALWLWMAWKNGRGRGWARIVATVLGGLNLISSVYTIAVGHSLAISEVLTVVDLILAVAILVLLWRRESSDFYAASRRPIS